MGFLEPHGRGRGAFRRDALTDARPGIVVHALAHAVAALTAAAEAGRPVVLLSAANAGISAGPGWWREMIAAAREAIPAAHATAVLDCGDDAGAAQAAIRAGIEAVVFTGHPDVAARLADIARQRGSRVLTVRPAAALDLAADFFAAPICLRQRCAEIIAGASAPEYTRIPGESRDPPIRRRER